MKALENKIALVTGAARGIGQAIAVQLAADGADLALCDVQADWLAETAAKVKALGRRAETYAMNVADGAAVAAAAAAAPIDPGQAAGPNRAEEAAVLPAGPVARTVPIAPAVCPAAAAVPTVAGAAVRLLIVDDDATNRVVLAETFRNARAEIVTVGNGRLAVEACRAGRFDLVFMDCQMPEMDGFEATRTILADCAARRQRAPVIVALTADATEAGRERCLEAGMVDHLVKPLDFAQLRRVLDQWLPELGGSVTPKTSTGPAAAAQPAAGDHARVIDIAVLERLREHVGGGYLPALARHPHQRPAPGPGTRGR